MALNRYLEAFYNLDASPNTYVPYAFWEKGGARVVAGTRRSAARRETPGRSRQPSASRCSTISRGGRPPGRCLTTTQLARDLGLDTLAVAELIVWIEREFGFSVGTPDSLQTVGDVVLAAGGKGDLGARGGSEARQPRLARPARHARADPDPDGRHDHGRLPRAGRARSPDGCCSPIRRAASGRTADLVSACCVLKPLIEALPGRYVGIMLPASVGAGTFYLACLFAGKTPVMVNWTTGPRNIEHSLDVLGVEKVITARALLREARHARHHRSTRSATGSLLVEDLRARITTGMKLRALVRSHLSWAALRRVRPPDEAVVLFTSGSESLPKAVPLTHGNILTNIRDVLRMVEVLDGDVLLGMLPPFHSFGITVTTILPLCSGLRTVYHPNPTEAAILARVIEAFTGDDDGGDADVSERHRASGARRASSTRSASP